MKRWVILLSIFFFAITQTAEARTFKYKKPEQTSAAKTEKKSSGNPRHAALVMNADTGKILLNENAQAIRYPASLTKMMTIYLTFEAIANGKLRWNQKLRVSQLAASQPQTNIFLQAGDKISVQDCVLALIVRSANDASYVLAEGIGGSKENFAYMMTKKARDLGMRNTTFKNPNGLPDKAQQTTAYDMAMLGIALRRDYADYYNLFKTQVFSYNGRTYKGHNKVLNRLDGVDGIKTGYIGASGFNLVSSMKKDGVNLIAVVMGGRSGSERDNYMVKILKSNYEEQYAMLRGGRSYAQASYPSSSSTRVDVDHVMNRMASFEPTIIAKAHAKDASSSTRTLDDQLSKLSSNEPTSEPKRSTTDYAKSWGIQIGAYRDKDSARQAAQQALSQLGGNVSEPAVAIASEGNKGNAIHRARLANLSRKEARSACQKLQEGGSPCFTLMVSN